MSIQIDLLSNEHYNNISHHMLECGLVKLAMGIQFLKGENPIMVLQ